MRRIGIQLKAAIVALLVASTCLSTPLVSRAEVQKALPPTTYTSSANQMTSSSATLQGSVYPSNQQTSYYFQYGPTTAYGAQTPLTPAGGGTKTIHVSSSVSGLAPYTVYHFRLVAIGPGGTAVGLDRSFRTLKIPLALSVTSAPNPVVFGLPFTIEGTLSGTGNVGVDLMVQANPFPYVAGFHDVGSAVTNATGGFSFSLEGLSKSTQVRLESIVAPIVTSPTVSEQVAVRITVHVKRTSHHGFAQIYGTVSPPVPGAGVAVERLMPDLRYVPVRGTVVSKGSRTAARFSRTMRVRPGVYRVLVHVSGGAYASAYSKPFRIRFG